MHGYHSAEWIRDLSGYTASTLVLATFSMSSMRRLRVIAICSNLAFISYGLVADLPPILILHCILLPLNIYRLAQLEQPMPALARLLPSAMWVSAGSRFRFAGSAERGIGRNRVGVICQDQCKRGAATARRAVWRVLSDPRVDARRRL